MQSSNVRIEQLLRFKVDNIFQVMLNDDNIHIYIHHIPGDNIQYDNFLHLLMVNVWQKNVHPGPTWIFWSFGRNVCCITKKTRPRSSGNLLASPQRWGPVATVRDQWRDSENPERSHELWNLNTFSEARNTLEYMGWVVVNGVYRFQVNWPTLDEHFGGSTTYYRMNLPTLSGNLDMLLPHQIISNYVVCCDLLGVQSFVDFLGHFPRPSHPLPAGCVLTPPWKKVSSKTPVAGVEPRKSSK